MLSYKNKSSTGTTTCVQPWETNDVTVFSISPLSWAQNGKERGDNPCNMSGGIDCLSPMIKVSN